MSNYLVNIEIYVKGHKIEIMKVGNLDYTSLTDLARYFDEDVTKYPIWNMSLR